VKTVKPLVEAKSELGNLEHIMDVLGTSEIVVGRNKNVR